VGFTRSVADLAGNNESLLEVLGRLTVAALPPVEDAEVAQRTGFTR